MARGLGGDIYRSSGLQHRKQGSKNKTELERIFKKLGKTVTIGTGKGLMELAQPLVDEVARSSPKYNEYTGNLGDSYAATVFISRKPSKTVYHDNEKGEIHYSEGPNSRGGRYANILKTRHGHYVSEIVNKGTKYEYENKVRKANRRRYLKRWEKAAGYRSNRTYGGTRNRKQIGYSAGTSGDFKAQNWIVIENKAPYAEWVQRGVMNPLTGRRNRPRRVLREGIARKLAPHATELIRQVTLKELKAVGFKIK